MTPMVMTAEYKLLRELADNAETGVRSDRLNKLAVTKAEAAGYVRYEKGYVVITTLGYDRIDEIEG